MSNHKKQTAARNMANNNEGSAARSRSSHMRPVKRTNNNADTAAQKMAFIRTENPTGLIAKANVEEDQQTIKKKYAEVLRQSGLLLDIVSKGFDKAYEHSPEKDKQFLDNLKKKNININDLRTDLAQQRGELVQKIHISR